MTAFSPKRNDPKYGRGTHSLANDVDASVLDEAEVTRRVRSAFAAPSYKPPMLPTVALEVMELSRKRDSTADQVTALLERDPLLAGRVLKIVRSPAYMASMPTVSLKQAVVRLGMGLVRDIVVEAAMNSKIFRASGGFDTTLETVRRHSMATGYLARLVTRHTAVEAEHAFLCGLLHDVGIAAALLIIHDTAPKGSVPRLSPVTWLVVERIHEEMSGALVNAWRMPAEVEAVVRQHHSVRVEGPPGKLVAVLAVAEHLARELGWGVEPSISVQPGDPPTGVHVVETDSTNQLTQALLTLQLEAKMLIQLHQEAVRELANVGGSPKST